MAYYKEKVKTGNEYVLMMQNLYAYTLNKCMKLPQRWYETILKPVIEPIKKARNYTVKANRVYIDFKNQNTDELINSIKERDNYLFEALREISVFDMAFNDLLSYIDIENQEKIRIKEKLENIIKTIKKENEELKNIEIKIAYRENEMNFVSVAGINSTKLKLTSQNINYWLTLEINAENKIKQRISKDKQFLEKLKNK